MDIEQVRVELLSLLEIDQVRENEDMSFHTTFRTGGYADFFLLPEVWQIPPLISMLKKLHVPYYFKGNGSNLLVSDKGYRGAIIELGQRAGEIEAMVAGRYGTIRAQAGAKLASVAAKAASLGLKGMEFASGIPGTIGGAVVMNAGAYESEMKDILDYALIMDHLGKVNMMNPNQLKLSYRHSIVPDLNYVVLGAKITLEVGNPDEIKRRTDEFKKLRFQKQPLEYPSAGSTFKRPQGYYAAKLIEDANLKGLSYGGAQVSTKHAGFIINKDEATSQDIYNLIKVVYQKVYNDYGVKLEPEVKFLGDFN